MGYDYSYPLSFERNKCELHMLIVFIVALIIVAGVGMYCGIKNGRERSKDGWENEIRYVTIGQIEDIIENMRANGATDDSVAVLMKADWWEDVK